MRGPARCGATAATLLVLSACGGARPTCRVPPPAETPAVVLPADCTPRNPMRIENLVFEGGGVKGVAYGGALAALEHAQLLAGVRRVAGTSAGAITATLVALRYTPAEIQSLMLHVPFARFQDGGAAGIFRIFRRYGYYRGDYFLRLMRCLVAAKTGNPDATFADLDRRGFLELRVFATDLETGRVVEYSRRRNAGVPVAEAVRMSMSIPLVFRPVRTPDHLLVDGGVLVNYPLATFDEGGVDEATLGFVLTDTDAEPTRRPIRHVVDFSGALIQAMLGAQAAGLELDHASLARTAVLNDLGIRATDFDLTIRQREALIAQGAACTCDYLRARALGRSAAWRTTLAPGTRVPVRHGGRCGWVLPR